ncbi:hypothetical protein HYR69_05725 [Candidatus Sumerlaeota bacterium]|nr:hypothetical protein [Candidatus Sumerlaeota bacterium]
MRDPYKVKTIVNHTNFPPFFIARKLWGYILGLYLLLLILDVFLGKSYSTHWPTRKRYLYLWVLPTLLLLLLLDAGGLILIFEKLPTPSEWRGKYYGFHYYSDGQSGLVIQAVGPNQRRDLEDLSVVPLGEAQEAERKQFLASYTYDPTNGVVSNGDIFLVRAPESSPSSKADVN